MHPEQIKILLSMIQRLIRRGATHNLQKIVNKSHAADVAAVFSFLPPKDQTSLFLLIDKTDKKAEVLSELGETEFLVIAEDMPAEEVVKIFEEMASDDVADLLQLLPDEKSKEILDLMEKEDSAEVEGLLRFEDDTAGGIMVPDFIALKEESTVGDAIAALQTKEKDVEMAFYLYVVDDYDHLVGVISLRQLVVARPATKLQEIMTTNVVSVHSNMDQEEVAKVVARYNILAVPVVDDNNVLLGIVTVDDVIDIIREEATEDILRMAGAGDELVETQSILRSTRTRLPWLFASWIGGIGAFCIIEHFEGALSKVLYLAAFIPIIMGMGGSVGTQSATIVVRGLAMGRFNVKQILPVVFKELAIGGLLGFFYGLLLGIVAHYRYDLWEVGIVVGFSVLCSMTMAATVGSCVPLLLARIKIDPAVATGSCVTTSIDILSVLLYFQIATLLLHI
ncbi:MAG: magnesium transporter [Deltaproteobacteria bacterium]|nr:magnesium transporter [Deltaproteobacteria bacterium]